MGRYRIRRISHAHAQKVPAADADIRQINEILENDGCAVVTNVLNAAQTPQRLKERWKPIFEKFLSAKGIFLALQPSA